MRASDDDSRAIVGLATALLLAVVFGVILLAEHIDHKPVQDGERAEGMVVGVTTVSRPLDEDLYRAQVAFTPAGQARRVVIEGTSKSQRTEIGKRVSVSYDPDDPTAAHVLDDDPSEGLLIGTAVVAVVLAIALAVACTAPKRRRRARNRAFDPAA